MKFVQKISRLSTRSRALDDRSLPWAYVTLATTCVPPRPISAVEASHGHQHAVAPPSMAQQQPFGELAAYRRPLADADIRGTAMRQARATVSPPVLYDPRGPGQSRGGGAARITRSRLGPASAEAKRGENPVQRRQISGIDLLSAGPGAQGSQGRRVEVPSVSARAVDVRPLCSSHRECRRRRRADQGPGSLGNSGDEQNRRSRTHDLNYDNSCQFCDPYSDMSYSGT